jgi:hypothetical protein
MTRFALVAVLALLACKDPKAAAPDAAPASVRVADAAPSMARAVPDAAAAAAAAAPPDAAAATAAATEESPPRPAGGKSIGVAPCDDYLEKMARCIGRLSAESAEPMRAAMDDTRKAWQETAATPEGRAALNDACTAALDAAKGAAKSMGCSW